MQAIQVHKHALDFFVQRNVGFAPNGAGKMAQADVAEFADVFHALVAEGDLAVCVAQRTNVFAPPACLVCKHHAVNERKIFCRLKFQRNASALNAHVKQVIFFQLFALFIIMPLGIQHANQNALAIFFLQPLNVMLPGNARNVRINIKKENGILKN